MFQRQRQDLLMVAIIALATFFSLAKLGEADPVGRGRRIRRSSDVRAVQAGLDVRPKNDLLTGDAVGQYNSLRELVAKKGAKFVKETPKKSGQLVSTNVNNARLIPSPLKALKELEKNNEDVGVVVGKVIAGDKVTIDVIEVPPGAVRYLWEQNGGGSGRSRSSSSSSGDAAAEAIVKDAGSFSDGGGMAAVSMDGVAGGSNYNYYE